MTYVCPVCSYGLLNKPPEDYSICPSCGTEFELDDRFKSPVELRREWLEAGAPWFSSRVKPPEMWGEYRASLLASNVASTSQRRDVIFEGYSTLLPITVLRLT